MGSKRMGLLCGHTLCTKWDPNNRSHLWNSWSFYWTEGVLVSIQAQPRTKTPESRCSAFPARPKTLSVVALFIFFFSLIIIGQQIKTKCEAAFVVESTERPSDLPTGSLSLLSLWVSVWLSVSSCLHLQYLDSPSQGCLICAENKKPGKSSADVGTDNRLLNNSHTVDLYLKSSARYYYRHLHLSV